MTTTQPMTSVKMHRGLYEVLGTSTACEIRRYGLIWVLYSDGAYVEAFDTKREALIHCQEHPEL